MDLFATALNIRFPECGSSAPDPLVWKGVAFSVLWGDRNVLIFPPFLIISRDINRGLRFRKMRLILIAPEWPQQGWYPGLLSFARRGADGDDALAEPSAAAPVSDSPPLDAPCGHLPGQRGLLLWLVPSKGNLSGHSNCSAGSGFPRPPSQGETPLTLSR